MVALSLQGQTKPNKLRFNTKGEFKVVQFTDVHYVPGKPEESKKALECIDQVLDAEQPDLVVLTGDIIYGSPAEEAIKEQGDVMGCFVGHDHDNDYAAMWHKVLLAYGRYTGGNTVYNHLPNGARVIVLKEGQRAFNTWISLRTGEIEQPTTYPDSFVKQ